MSERNVKEHMSGKLYTETSNENIGTPKWALEPPACGLPVEYAIYV
jgi:hypothetical protein